MVYYSAELQVITSNVLISKRSFQEKIYPKHGELKVLLKIYGYIHKARTLMKYWIKYLGKTNHIIDKDGAIFKMELSLILYTHEI